MIWHVIDVIRNCWRHTPPCLEFSSAHIYWYYFPFLQRVISVGRASFHARTSVYFIVTLLKPQTNLAFIQSKRIAWDWGRKNRATIACLKASLALYEIKTTSSSVPNAKNATCTHKWQPRALKGHIVELKVRNVVIITTKKTRDLLTRYESLHLEIVMRYLAYL